MNSDALEVVREFNGALGQGPRVDMKAAFEDPVVREPVTRLIDADAPIEFAVPDGGFMGQMAGPFAGAEGYVAGWREWLEVWDEFEIEIEEEIDAGAGKVLVLVDATGRLKGAEARVPQKAGALYTVANGRIVALEHFLAQDQARKAAGLG